MWKIETYQVLIRINGVKNVALSWPMLLQKELDSRMTDNSDCYTQIQVIMAIAAVLVGKDAFKL